MRASVVTEFGGPEVLKVREVPTPQPGPGQVALRLGQPVAALTLNGGYAEVALAQAICTFPLDGSGSTIDLTTAAGFPTIVPTAYDLLVHVARLQQGEGVLIHAAAGGVGIIAGQIARHLGAGIVIGTASNHRKAAYASTFGYDKVVLYDEFKQSVHELTNGRGVDIVLEAVGEPIRSQSLAALAPFGRLVIFGNANNNVDKALDIPLESGTFLTESKAIMGYSIGTLSQSAPHLVAATARLALDLVAQSQVKIDITDILPLEQAREAHRRLESSEAMGKLLLRV
jgi:NADPH2:quinone reductase